MESILYPDSSFLVSLHRGDRHHEAARLYVGRTVARLFYTPLHRLELRNALRNAVTFGQMSSSGCRVAFRQVDEDLQDGLLIHTPIPWTDAFRRADQLSETHMGSDGQRTIDLLHVAVALECGARTFLSFDQRQRKLAAAAGLKVKP